MNPSLAAARRRFATLVDERVGIINRVDLVRPAPRAPAAFVAHAEPSSTVPLTGMEAANRGGAASADPDRAVVRACGESIERYCSGLFDLETMELATAEALRDRGDTVLGVESMYPFAPHQYDGPDFPFDRVDGRRQRWVIARDVASRLGGATEPRQAWVPASCVWVPYRYERKVEPFTHMPISTGLAAGERLEDCLFKGILEILERDALMIRWHNRIPADRICVDSCLRSDPALRATLEAARPTRAEWHISLLTLDVEVPVVCAALIDPDGVPMTAVGVAAHTDPRRAVLLAAEEALLGRVLINRSSELAEGTPINPVPATLRGHMMAHAALPELRAEFEYLIDGPRSTTLDELEDRFRTAAELSLTDRVTLAGGTPWYVDVTTPDVAAAGMSVGRVVIPGFQPLDNDHRHRFLGGGRLSSVPRALGLPVPAEPNPLPHPFP